MISLTHLTFVGANVNPATIEFGERLTLVRGPSDTGKSFIVDAIDFMLGSRELKNVPEREGFADVLLGIRIDSTEWTLMRSVIGGPFSLFEGRLTERPPAPAQVVLANTHNPGNSENLSMWLLQAVGLAGARLRKNARNDTDSLSFRDLARLVVVNETDMQSDVPPALSGRPTGKTKEVSLLKLLLEGDDDSNLVASPVPRDERRLKGARLEVIDQLISNLEERLAQSADLESVRDQAARVNGSIQSATDSIGEISAARSNAATAVQRDQTRRRAIELRVVQIAGLRARFGLLHEQYISDLARLEMIVEGGSLLGFFEADACPLCGAAPEHQHHTNFSADEQGLSFAAAVERDRTNQLISDLEATFTDLADRESELQHLAEQYDQRIAVRTSEVVSLDQRMSPNRSELAEYLSLKSNLESTISSYAQLAELQQVRAQIEDEAIAEIASVATAIGARAIDEFSIRLSARLRAWGYEAADGARYDRVEQDVFADGQFRSDHGKGVRAILHAAFSIALADYCFANGSPHPGFIVLDSPLITYRAPDEEGREGPGQSFGTAFYHDLEERFEGQIIVMENTDPLESLSEATVDIEFTKVEGFGRYGYFPHPT